MIKNSKGNVYYGMHFYPGVAEYQEPGSEPHRVFLNEDTIRSMDPTFAGRPIFVEHVNEVDEDIDELRKEADGWVIESFYNSADGKHWVKFIIVSERGERAIKNGLRLSNAYVPLKFASGGLWNGVSYAKEITAGEYDHLAVVSNPRYEESVIMTPDDFKKYNDDKVIELKRLSNSKDDKKGNKMAFKIFKRTKVENALDPDLSIVLPKSGREITVTQLVNEMDDMEEKKKANNVEANPEHMVKMHDGTMCNVGELVEKHKALHDELESMKGEKTNEEEGDLNTEETEVDSESVPAMNEEEDVKKKMKPDSDEKEVEAKKKMNEIATKKAEAKRKADALRNASAASVAEETQVIEFSSDMVARGKARYGSN